MIWRDVHTRDVPSHTLTETDDMLASIVAARGVLSDEQRNISLAALAPVSQLGGLPQAVALLQQHHDGRIMIVGDFDADGATSTALMLRGLAALGFAHVDFIVPNRFDFGYGLSPEIVDVAIAESPTLIVTVDNGISSNAGVARAREQGIDVLITDHHLPPKTLPDANVIVNPNCVDDDYPSKHLAGVGVAFCVLVALARHIAPDDPAATRMPASLLDLVALGTVADVVPLDRNNRILVDAGLQRIRAGRCVPGIAALLDVGGRDRTRVVATDFGFAVGPRLNAAGRLQDMSVGIRCLTTDDPVLARQLAEQLDAINRERRTVEADMQADALKLLETLDDAALSEQPQYCVCLYEPDWHQGVVGLVASRIKERLHRPVFAFAREREGATMLKGSGRSIPGVHLRDVLAEVARREPGIIVRFGGHAMAAGLTLAEDALPMFSACVDAVVKAVCPQALLTPAILVDGTLDAQHLDIRFAQTLRDEGPWGQEFVEPSFTGTFDVVSARVVGEHHLKLSVSYEGAVIDGIAFNQIEPDIPQQGARIELVYRLDVNEWRGKQSAQLMILQWRYPDV
ncbi:MAG: single-stranded-DNA-specific exonuclease RecJ [Pseudomonadota bacterium]